MEDPVVTPDMIRYEKIAIYQWIDNKGTCPLTRKKLTKQDLKPDL